MNRKPRIPKYGSPHARRRVNRRRNWLARTLHRVKVCFPEAYEDVSQLLTPWIEQADRDGVKCLQAEAALRGYKFDEWKHLQEKKPCQ